MNSNIRWINGHGIIFFGEVSVVDVPIIEIRKYLIYC